MTLATQLPGTTPTDFQRRPATPSGSRKIQRPATGGSQTLADNPGYGRSESDIPRARRRAVLLEIRHDESPVIVGWSRTSSPAPKAAPASPGWSSAERVSEFPYCSPGSVRATKRTVLRRALAASGSFDASHSLPHSRGFESLLYCAARACKLQPPGPPARHESCQAALRRRSQACSPPRPGRLAGGCRAGGQAWRA